MIEIRVPEVGESISEGILAGWLKDEGEQVAEGEALFELETDKVTLEVQAEDAGALTILVAEGETVKVGQVVARIDTAAEPKATSTTASPSPGPAGDGPSISAPAGVDQAQEKLGRQAIQKFSPAVRQLVLEHQLDPARIHGSGKDGRITKGDVLQYLDERQQTEPLPQIQAQAQAQVQTQAPAAQVPEPATPRSDGATSDGQSEERETRVPLTPFRQRIAERLVEAQQTAAMLTTFNEVDMSAVIAFRQRYKERFQEKYGVRLGFMSFFVKAAVDALKEVPALNSRIEGGEIVTNHYYDIGVAVNTDKGLIVPVVRGADGLSFAQIEEHIADLASRGRARRLTLDELTGGCFTISNGGIYGSLLSTPILNPPQSGILGMHQIQKRPVVVDDQIVIRPMMYLAVSYDHRVVDGRQAVTFLKRIVSCLEDPERLLLEI